MAGMTISGNNASYTLSLSMADSYYRYHVFVADLSSTGSIQGYYCRRTSLGVAGTTWTYSSTSSAPYCYYQRRVIVRISKAATSHSVGGYYTYSEVTSGTNSYFDDYIPAAPEPTTKTFKYRIHAFGNGGTISGSNDIYKPSSSTWYTTTQTTTASLINVTFDVANLPTPVQSGYIFNGWAQSSSDPSGATSGTVTVEATTSGKTNNLYATWIEPKTFKYRVHAFGNGGTIDGSNDIYKPSSSTWYTRTQATTASSINVTFAVANLSTPVRYGYTFNGWAQSSSDPSGATSGTVTVEATTSGKTNNLYATWTKNHIGLFYWDGSTGSGDASLISSGQPVGNITGGSNGNWNRLKAKIAALRTAQGGSWSYTNVSTGDDFTAAEFNDVRSGIDACTGHGTLPSARSRGDTIYAHYFQSTTANPNSLKSALNTAITTYNNS